MIGMTTAACPDPEGTKKLKRRLKMNMTGATSTLCRLLRATAMP